MGIQVECPNGHVFKVKDKYAGKKGLCPKCEGQVVVLVPDALHGKTEDAYRQAVLQEHRAAHSAPPTSSSVLDDALSDSDSGTSASLIGSSVIRHNVKCECGAHVPMWYAKCPSCGRYMEQR